MSATGWIVTIIGAVVGTTLFEIVFHWLFGVKKTKIHPSQDPAYQTRIRWWKKLKRWL